MTARYQYRIYPSHGQQAQLAQLFGCCRVVWNDALAYCISQYQSGGQKPTNSQLQKQFITAAKKTADREWLKKVSNIPLQQSLNDLEQAYQNFFKSCKGERKGKRVKPPKFKKRHAQQSARFRKGGFKLIGEQISLAKIGKLKVVWSRSLPTQPSSVTVVKDAAHRYFLSFVVEIEPETLPESPNSVGIDLGIKTFAVLSNGDKVDAPKPLKKRIKRLRRVDRNLSKKERGSNRYNKAKQRRAKLYAQLKDTRKYFLHKLSTQIINENSVLVLGTCVRARKHRPEGQVIVLEDLNVSGMVRNRKLSRAISDLGWRQFRTLLEGKAEKYNRDFRVISRWEATTQKCHKCGFKAGKLDLSIREWTCLSCGTTHDRDENAAINILVAGGHTSYGGASLTETLNGRGGSRQTTATVAASCEASTHPEYVQLSLFNC